MAAVAAFTEAEIFAERRGLIAIAQVASVSRLSPLLELGRFDEVVEQADALLPTLDMSGNVFSLVEARGLKARALVEQGREGAAEAAQDAFLAAVEIDKTDQMILAAVPAALAQVANGGFDAARNVLSHVAAIAGVKDSAEYAARLPALVRSSLAAGDPDLATRLVRGFEPTLPVREHALAATAALLAESRGDHLEAADQFSDAAFRWDRFGARLERAYALVGQGRCLAALGDSTADVPLREARALFHEMGARPRIDECDNLIALASKLSS